MDLKVEHNIEVAHRISLPGKCQNIHGHSMWVTLWLKNLHMGESIAGGLDFGAMKKDFRGYLDGKFDHHLLLWSQDEWLLFVLNEMSIPPIPGLVETFYDPTVENIALDIKSWAIGNFAMGEDDVRVYVQETRTNGVRA